MARPSSSYDPESYGKGFTLMPKGVHSVRLLLGQEEMSRRGQEQWYFECEPIDPQYRDPDRPLKMWLPEDGVVNALFDAAGVDPRKAKDKDWRPQEFEGKIIKVEIIHKKVDSGAEFANIRRPHPTFSLGDNPPEPGRQPQQRPATPPPPRQEESFDDDFGNPPQDDIPF